MRIFKTALIITFAIAVSRCFLTPLCVPIFKGAEGIYSVTYGGCSSGVTESFSTCKMEKFYNYNDIDGQSLCTENGGYVKSFLKDKGCKLMFTENIDGIVIKYYYTPKISVYRSINGKKVNIQTAENKGNFTIGSPMIYGGY